MHRRDFLKAAAVAGAAPAATSEAIPKYKVVTPYKPQGKLGAPGLSPGRVMCCAR